MIAKYDKLDDQLQNVTFEYTLDFISFLLDFNK